MKDSDSIRKFAGALTDMVNQALGSEFVGSFTPISYPNGFPYFWQYGPNSYYNQATLELVDKRVSIDSNGICVFQDDSFSGLFLRILQNVQFVVSASDQGAITLASTEVDRQSDATVAAFEREVGPITPEQIKSSDVFPPTKIAYIVKLVTDRWGGDPSRMPDTLAKLRTAYKQWTIASWTLRDLQSRQTNAMDLLIKARSHTLGPVAENGGAQVNAGSYRVRFQGFAPTNAIIGSLGSADRSLTVKWSVTNVSSTRSRLSLSDGKAAWPASSNVVTLGLSENDQQRLKDVSGSASAVDISITYPGLTIIQAQPMPLAVDLTTGWYAEEILAEVAEKTSPAFTGFQLAGDEYSVDDLFGAKKKFARVKTFVVSGSPTIKLTFHNADQGILRSKYQLGHPIRMSLAETFQFGADGPGLKVQSVEAAGANDIVVTIAPPKADGSILPQDLTAHILGGVVDFPPVVLTSPEPGIITVKNEGWFVARFSVQYLQNGETRTKESGSFSKLFARVLQLPADASQILLTMEIETTVNQWSVVATIQYRRPVTKSFELRGVTWRPEIEPPV